MSEAKCTVPGDADGGVVLQVGECLAKDLQYSKGRKRKQQWLTLLLGITGDYSNIALNCTDKFVN